MELEKSSSNTVWHHSTVSRERRQALNGHKSAVIWFTGLSGAGKSTLAHAVEEELHLIGCRTYVLDGDNVRRGLCGDLGFSAGDRRENIRRIREVVKLFTDAGIITLSAFISPFRSDRAMIRSVMPQGEFLEIYCRCPLSICEQRDVKGLYRKAREGQIKEFTGLSSPYEPPEKPELIVDTHGTDLAYCVQRVMNLVYERGILAKPEQAFPRVDADMPHAVSAP